MGEKKTWESAKKEVQENGHHNLRKGRLLSLSDVLITAFVKCGGLVL